MNKLIPIALAVITATPVLADGHTAETGLYGFAFGGLVVPFDTTLSGTINGGSEDVDTDFDDTGFTLGLGVGTALPGIGEGIRGELELSYSDTDVDSVDFSGNGPGREVTSGDITTTRVFASLYKDFDTIGSFTPYAGAGVGVAFTDFDVQYGPGVELDDNDESFSVQIVAGGAFALTDRLDLTTDVRYIRDFDVESERFAPTGASTGSVSDDFESVNVNVGLRFSF